MMGVKMECKKLYERCKKTPICTKIDITLANTSHYFFSKDNKQKFHIPTFMAVLEKLLADHSN